VSLNLEEVQALALAIYGLATNAVKYGALKPNNGRLEITWSVVSTGRGGQLPNLLWKESGVAMPADTPRRGHGRKLIESGLPYALRAKTEPKMGNDGVTARIEVPLAPKEPAGSTAKP